MSKDQMKLTDARTLVAKMVIKSGISGLKASRFDLYPKHAFKQAMAEAKNSIWGSQYFTFEQAWGVSGDLQVEFKDGHTLVGGKKHPCSEAHVKVSWGSTGRSLTEARAVIKLYSDLVDLGCLIDAHVNGLDIETSDDAYKRWEKASNIKRAKKLEEEKAALVNAHVLDPEDPKGVSSGLYGDMGAQCEGITGKGEQCKAYSKLGVWSKKQQRFIPTCNRHLLQVQALVIAETPAVLEGIAPSSAA